MRVLHVEDNPVDVDLTRRSLLRQAPEIRLDPAPTLAAARDRLQRADDYDLALIDLKLPDGSGLELLTEIRERGLPLAVVMLTGGGDPDAAITALQAGADDYLAKGNDVLERLPATLRAAWTRFRATCDRRAQPLRVLYAEHTLADIDLTRRHLARYAPHVRLVPVADVAQILAHLPLNADTAADYDVVLLDYHLPGLDALEAVKVLRTERGLDIPIILVSGQISEAVAAQAMHLGVNDYLSKHAGYLHQLPALLDKAINQVTLVRERAVLLETTQRLELALAASTLHEQTRDTRLAVLDGLAENQPLAEILSGIATSLEAIHPHLRVAIHLAPDALAEQTAEAAASSTIWPISLEDDAGQSLGQCIVTAIEPRPPSAAELDRIDEFARLASLAVTRSRADTRLRQAAAVFESTREGVVITDLDACILNVNRAYSAITGYTEDDVRGRQPNISRSDRQDRAFYHALWASVKATGYWQGEIWNRRKSGELYPALLSISTVYDHHRQPSHYVGVITDLSQLKESEAQLEHLIHYDPLTNLPNRRLIQSRLQHALEQAERQQHQLAVLVIDLDRFKNVNDSLGHPIGDELLKALAIRLSTRLREDDTLARLGGDEFLLLLEHLECPQHAAEVAQMMLELLDQPFVLPDGNEIYVAASIGISLYPNDGDSVTELIKHADVALYQAKEQGRNTYRFYIPTLTTAANERLALDARLRRALVNGEFILHYQPQFDSQSGEPIGCEALVRWLSPEEGMISPARFIPLAEETGLIVPLGEWVLRTACAQGKAWLDAGFPPLTIAVNLSGRQLQQPDLVEHIAAILEQTGLPSDQLKLELTESMIMGHSAQTLELLHAIKALGPRLSIDDFGTGYSSLAYLKRFPIDELKIDQSFVRDIPQSESDMEIAATIIAMARNLHLRVIAEGVETPAQLEFLIRQGCHACQGYLLGHPLPADAFVRAVLQRDLKS